MNTNPMLSTQTHDIPTSVTTKDCLLYVSMKYRFLEFNPLPKHSFAIVTLQ